MYPPEPTLPYRRAIRPNRNASSEINTTFGSQIKISGWNLGFPRTVSTMTIKKK